MMKSHGLNDSTHKNVQWKFPCPHQKFRDAEWTISLHAKIYIYILNIIYFYKLPNTDTEHESRGRG